MALGLKATGTQLVVTVSGSPVITATDSAFSQGDVGLWSYTPAGAGAHRFDDFTVTPANPTPATQAINYTYDPLSRLTTASYDTGLVFTYTYDAVGNRLTQTITNTTVYTYDDANRLTNAGGVAYTWNANGNLLNDGVFTYTYDTANRLSTVNGGGVTASYAYNGMGARQRQVTGGITTTYTLDLNAGLVQVLADSGGNTYLYGNGRIAQFAGSTASYFLADHLGSVRQLTNASGAVTLAKGYEPYGSMLSSVGAGASSYGFTEELTDNTGLVYLRARYLSTSIGRFISKDVWPGNYHRPQSLNPWQYVEGKPINLADPSGRIPRLGGVCPNPSGNPYEEVPPYAPGDLIDRRNRMYIYCGEFALTAYQFISREDQYDSSQTRVALGTSYSPSALFVEDVRLNGTGRTASPAFLPVCFGGYFTNVQYTTGPNSEPAFRFDCRKGKEYNVAPYPLGDMYRAAAADLVRLKLNSEVYLPEMCGEGRPCTGSYNPDLVIRDTGNAIRGLRLDIFAGEGPGLRSRDLNQSPSVAWGGQHRYLGITITWDGRSAIGPTPGYQRVPTEYEQFYRALYCDNTAPPGGPR